MTHGRQGRAQERHHRGKGWDKGKWGNHGGWSGEHTCLAARTIEHDMEEKVQDD